MIAESATAVLPAPDEMMEARQWTAATFENVPESNTAPLCFSFTYDGKPSGELLGAWKFLQDSRALDQQRTVRTLSWTEPGTGLEVRCVLAAYSDFPVVEWTVYLRNTGSADSQLLENIKRWMPGGSVAMAASSCCGASRVISALRTAMNRTKSPLEPMRRRHSCPTAGGPPTERFLIITLQCLAAA